MDKITALYVRVSSDEQARDGHSIANQTSKLKTYAELQGWSPAEVFIDDGWSGKDMERPSMKRLVKLIKQGRVSAVVTLALDRLSRRTMHILQFVELLDAHQARYISVTQQFDTSTPVGRMMLSMLAAAAEFERDMISERVKSNLAGIVERQGRYVSGEAPFGYEYDDKKQLRISDAEARWLLQSADMYINGHGYRAVTKWLNDAGVTTRRGNAWNPTTVKQMLLNEVYLGKLIYNRTSTKGRKTMPNPESDWIIVENAHPAIYTEALWQQLQERAGRITKQKQGSKLRYRLSGLVYCGFCGGKMHSNTYRPRQGKYQYDSFSCSTYKSGKGCRHHYVQVEDVERDVFAALERFAQGMVPLSPDSLREASEARHKQYERRASAIDAKFQRQIQAWENGLIGDHDLRLARERIEAEREALAAEMEHAAGGRNEIAESVISRAREVVWLWGNADLPEIQQALRTLLDSVVIKDSKVHAVRLSQEFFLL